MKISERPGPGFFLGEAKDRALGSTQQEDLMRKFHRAITAGVLSVPMVLAIGGVASAEGSSFDQHQAAVGSDGVASQQVGSHVKDNGDASFQKSDSSVGPEGVASQQVGSNVKDNGDASFQKSNSSVGPDGASSGNTSSNTGHDSGLLGGVLGL